MINYKSCSSSSCHWLLCLSCHICALFVTHNRSFEEHLLNSLTMLLNLSFLSLSPRLSLLLSSPLLVPCVLSLSDLSPAFLSHSFSQYGGVGPVGHSGGPGAWRATCDPQRGLWPPCRRGHPEAGGEDTWVTVCLPLFVSAFHSTQAKHSYIICMNTWEITYSVQLTLQQDTSVFNLIIKCDLYSYVCPDLFVFIPFYSRE